MTLTACSPEDTSDSDSASIQTGESQEPTLVIEDAAEEPTLETLPQVRQIVPGGPTNALQPGEQVERLPTPAIPPTPPRAVNLGIVIVEEANRLRTRRGMVTLAGTRLVNPELQCELEDGRTPLCGTLARLAVRRYVGRRLVTCTLGLREDSGQDHNTSCTLGDNDLSIWALERGWALANEDATALQKVAEGRAREGNLGLWGFDLPEAALANQEASN